MKSNPIIFATLLLLSAWLAPNVYAHALASAPSNLNLSGHVYDTTPTFSWSSVAEANYYRLAILQGSVWVINPEPLPSSTNYTLPSADALTVGQCYTWTVRAEHAIGHAGPWAPSKSICIKALTAPTNLTPGHTNDPTPTLRWHSVAGANYYRVAIKKGSTWVINPEPLPTTNRYTLTSAQALTVGQCYSYNVRAERALGDYGPWSATKTLCIDGYDKPTTNNPVGYIDDATPYFSWGSVSGASYYRLSITQGSTPVLSYEPTPSGTSYTLSSALQDGQCYNWTVRAEGGLGLYGPWSDSKSFCIDLNNAPAITVTEPNGYADSADSSYLIKWTDSDPDDNASISFYYDNNNYGNNGTSIVTGLSEDYDGSSDQYMWNTSNVAPGSYYVYGVISDGQASTTDYSSGKVTIGHIETIALNASGMVFSEGTINIKKPDNSSFNEVISLQKYQDGDFSSSGISVQLTNNNTTITASFIDGEVYRLRVGSSYYTLTRDTSMNQHINVVAHGATPYAPTSISAAKDNRAAFVASINAVSKYGTVFVPKGKWLIKGDSSAALNALVLKSNMTLAGAGQSKTLLVSPRTSIPNAGATKDWSYAGIKGFGLSNVRLSDLTIHGLYNDKTVTIPKVNAVGGQYAHFSNAVILSGDNLTVERIGVKYANTGISIRNPALTAGKLLVGFGNTIRDNSVNYTHQAVSMLNMKDSQIVKNSINQVDTQGIITEIAADDSDRDPYNDKGRKKGTVRNIKIVGNSVTGAQHRGLHLGPLDGGLVIQNSIGNNANTSSSAHNMSTGIIANGNNNIIMDNTISGAWFGEVTQGSDYQSSSANGIKLENGPENALIAYNCINNSESDGIALKSHTKDILITTNSITNTGQRGIRLESGSFYSVNTAQTGPFQPTQTCENASPTDAAGYPAVYSSNRQGRCFDTDISNVFLIDNDISGVENYSHYSDGSAGWVSSEIDHAPASYPWPNRASKIPYQCSSAGSCGYFNDGDLFYSVFPSLRAHNNVGTLIAMYQNPYYKGRTAGGGAVTPVYGSISNVFMGYVKPDGSKPIMYDAFASGIRTHLAASVNKVKVLENGLSQTVNTELNSSSAATYWSQYKTRLVAFQTLWHNRFGTPSGDELSTYTHLTHLINHADDYTSSGSVSYAPICP